jgi:hypothetical protein
MIEAHERRDPGFRQSEFHAIAIHSSITCAVQSRINYSEPSFYPSRTTAHYNWIKIPRNDISAALLPLITKSENKK